MTKLYLWSVQWIINPSQPTNQACGPWEVKVVATTMAKALSLFRDVPLQGLPDGDAVITVVARGDQIYGFGGAE